MSFALACCLALAADPAPLRGRVVWSGDIPVLPPTMAYRPGPDGKVGASRRPAANAPQIDATTRGVAGVVVTVISPVPTTGEWPHPPVTVEQHDGRPMVRQGNDLRTVGLVRRGDAVTLVSRQELFHSLRARGAAFWTLAFPDPDKPLTRCFDRTGLVELSSGAGHYWMRGYLRVCDHPFVAVTDAAGRFEIAGLPAGEYEVTCWLPNWRVTRQERDPESTAVVRIAFAEPLERRARVTTGDAVELAFP